MGMKPGKMTDKHKAAILEGRRLAAQRKADEGEKNLDAYKAWSKRDSVRWAELQAAIDLKDEKQIAKIRQASKEDRMPPIK